MMEDARRGAALRRIDAALQRIEAATSRRGGGDRVAQGQLAHLAARHDALRAEMQAAVAALDRVIAGETA